ncbi:lysophospholipase [Glycomyces sp. L485]|uniref:alpha/beta hydrolase n=1 Tax=Glycomyces sp. L485 TaxID=2909235 RepID=UPI001F4A139F|nr:alpha/beta fold hydrolase [Glycomyces sp. L485]MCH7229875.1 lysophospholipase [Glycomyces sp. L485]
MPWAGIVRVSVIVLIVVALVFLAVWFGQRSLIYHPDESTPSVPPDAAAVTLHTADGLDLTAWEFAPEPSIDREAAVLVAHGNAGNRAGRAPLGRALAAEGFTVLLLEYRGYGGNPGSPSENGLYDDARAAWGHLRERFAADRIALFGESIGAGVVTRLSTEVDPAALVLRSPFTSLADAGKEHYPLLPVDLILRDRFPVVEDLASNGAPVTVVYSDADEIVPADQSKAVAGAAEAAGTPVTLVHVEATGHNDPALVAGDEVVDAVVETADGLGLTTGR